MIKLITFDLWNTIVSGNHSDELNAKRVKYIQNILSENGHNPSEESIYNALDYSWKYFMKEWHNRHYTPTSNAMTAKVFEYMNIERGKADFLRIVKYLESSLLTSDNCLIEGIEDLLKNLYTHYSLAIISDAGYTPGRYLRLLLKKLNVAEYFSFFAFSDEMGVSKPDVRIFMHTLNYFDIKPDEALHIGDLLSTDIEGASKTGMHSVHFRKEEFKNNDDSRAKPSFETHNTEDIFAFIKSI